MCPNYEEPSLLFCKQIFELTHYHTSFSPVCIGSALNVCRNELKDTTIDVLVATRSFTLINQRKLTPGCKGSLKVYVTKYQEAIDIQQITKVITVQNNNFSYNILWMAKPVDKRIIKDENFRIIINQKDIFSSILTWTLAIICLNHTKFLVSLFWSILGHFFIFSWWRGAWRDFRSLRIHRGGEAGILVCIKPTAVSKDTQMRWFLSRKETFISKNNCSKFLEKLLRTKWDNVEQGGLRTWRHSLEERSQCCSTHRCSTNGIFERSLLWKI